MTMAGAGQLAETAAVGVGTGSAHAVQNHRRQALSESLRTGEPVSAFQLLRGDPI
ncbi:hypothetical protein [Nocardia flavorosea]|uniref:hypothetical protein n=1 Tax=Nocardia flavorosea TaxID=53429 RepID=UPI000A6592A8|nr:hypothetical protein [Nocardia flavorosea]